MVRRVRCLYERCLRVRSESQSTSPGRNPPSGRRRKTEGRSRIGQSLRPFAPRERPAPWPERPAVPVPLHVLCPRSTLTGQLAAWRKSAEPHIDHDICQCTTPSPRTGGRAPSEVSTCEASPTYIRASTTDTERIANRCEPVSSCWSGASFTTYPHNTGEYLIDSFI